MLGAHPYLRFGQTRGSLVASSCSLLDGMAEVFFIGTGVYFGMEVAGAAHSKCACGGGSTGIISYVKLNDLLAFGLGLI